MFHVICDNLWQVQGVFKCQRVINGTDLVGQKVRIYVSTFNMTKNVIGTGYQLKCINLQYVLQVKKPIKKK